ncbi:MAG: septum formation initiator family protein [Lactobacillus sp.]|jgi:cell division protein DivIC|nr:septum formation initiator family protein [Lactobacillus sp.]
MYEKQPQKQKVQSLDNQYIQTQTVKHIEARRQAYIKRVQRRRLTLLGVVVLVVVLALGIQIFKAHQNTNTLQAQTQQSQAQLKQVRQENADFKLKINELNNADYLEKVVREKYYYSKPGEIIFSLPGDKPSN